MKKTIALDFDGVLSAYHGWQGELVLDPPLAGAIQVLRDYLTADFKLVIFTTRGATNAGIALLESWLSDAGLSDREIEQIEITDHKPPAWLYIDDRCYCFKGTFPSIQEIDEFKAWWQLPPSSQRA